MKHKNIVLAVVVVLFLIGLYFVTPKDWAEPEKIMPEDKFLFNGFGLTRIEDDLIACGGELKKVSEQVFICLE